MGKNLINNLILFSKNCYHWNCRHMLAKVYRRLIPLKLVLADSYAVLRLLDSTKAHSPVLDDIEEQSTAGA